MRAFEKEGVLLEQRELVKEFTRGTEVQTESVAVRVYGAPYNVSRVRGTEEEGAS